MTRADTRRGSAAPTPAVVLLGLLVAGTDPSSTAWGGSKAFVDVTEAVGLAYRLEPYPAEDRLPEEIKDVKDGGLALADIDGDGRLELYVAHGYGWTGRLFGWDGTRFAAMPGNRGIEPAAMDRAGYFFDLDHDGHPDFLSIQSSGLQTFRNLGNGRFKEAPHAFGMRKDRWIRSLAAADYDGDGDVDLMFAHWGTPWDGLRPPSGYLWRNDGNGRYEDISRTLPVRPGVMHPLGPVRWPRAFSFTPVFADVDEDGDPDILLTGDFRTSQVLRNDAGGTFTDITTTAITDENGMGAAVGDYDGGWRHRLVRNQHFRCRRELR